MFQKVKENLIRHGLLNNKYNHYLEKISQKLKPKPSGLWLYNNNQNF